VGFNNRILTIDLETGEAHEYVYTIEATNQGRGVNEMLAISDHEFLVLERDNINYQPQRVHGPTFPPGQIKKAVRKTF
jgi:hypothetical protein